MIDCWRIDRERMRALYEDAGVRMQLSRFETMQVSNPVEWRVLPGLSTQPAPIGFLKRVVKRSIGWPIQCAFDTMSIGVKER